MSRLKNLLPPQPPEEEIGTENRMKSAPQNFDFNNWEFRDNGQRVNTHRKKTSGLQNTAQNLGSRTEPFPTNSPVSHGPLVSEFEFNGLLDVVEDKCRREDCPFPQPNIPVYNLPSEIVQAQPQTSPIWPPMSLPPPPPIPPQFSASLPGKSPQSSPPQNISIPTEDQIFKTPKSLQKRQSDQSEDYKDRIEAVGRENLSEKKEAQKELAKTPTTEGCKLEKDGIIDLCDSDDEFESGQVKASVPSQSSKAVSIPCKSFSVLFFFESLRERVSDARNSSLLHPLKDCEEETKKEAKTYLGWSRLRFTVPLHFVAFYNQSF